MITKLGKEIVENSERQKTVDQSLGVGAAAGLLGPIGAEIARGPIHILLDSAMSRPRPRLTEKESESLIKAMLGIRKDIAVVDLPRFFQRGSQFNPATKTVSAPKDSYILAHELGHATGLMGRNRAVGSIGSLLTHGIGGPKIAPIVRSIHSAQKAYNREIGLPESEDSKALDALSTATQIGTAGQLAEEAQASIRGLHAIGKIQGRAGMLQAAKMFAPAFGTYALGAAAYHGVAPWLGGKIGGWLGKLKMKAQEED